MTHAHDTIAELESNAKLSWEQVYQILSDRSGKDSMSGHRAARWCETHPEYAPKAARKVQAKPAPKPTGLGSRGGDPGKAERAILADAAGPRGSSPWWSAYRATRKLANA